MEKEVFIRFFDRKCKEIEFIYNEKLPIPRKGEKVILEDKNYVILEVEHVYDFLFGLTHIDYTISEVK